MDKDEMLFMLKLKSLELVALEMLQDKGLINTPAMYKKAKRIYEGGLEADILNWESIFDKESVVKTPKPKPVEKEIVKQGLRPTDMNAVKAAMPSMKVCPKCQEEIPNTWAKHQFKKDGKLCGHIF